MATSFWCAGGDAGAGRGFGLKALTRSVPPRARGEGSREEKRPKHALTHTPVLGPWRTWKVAVVSSVRGPGALARYGARRPRMELPGVDVMMEPDGGVPSAHRGTRRGRGPWPSRRLRPPRRPACSMLGTRI
ncbi:hypothetical protein BS78_03G282700 [Paspalum vaginatum]|nr:hypothetical protein BS78_03G282700 [Paspalum vaginatum]